MYEQLGLWDYPENSKPTEKQSQLAAESLLLPDGDVVIYRALFDEKESNQLFIELYNNTKWRQESIKIYGKSVPIPRLTAWYGDSNQLYTYSKIAMSPEAWTPPLLEIKSKIESLSGVQFNSALLNLYRSGSDSVAWHSDDEPELGNNPIIGSVSFGGTRQFMFRHKYKKDLKKKVNLTCGNFLIMRGTTQHFWQHQIPKTAKPVEPRINLTFRVIK
jgi:alkylated DNA repair dioxygenase AlkB